MVIQMDKWRFLQVFRQDGTNEDYKWTHIAIFGK